MWLQKVGIVLLSLALPVMWGVAVNWGFQRVRSRKKKRRDDDNIFPDYQI